MKTSDFLQELEQKAKGVLFISESEYPFTVETFGTLAPETLSATVAQQSGADPGQVKTLNAATFIAGIEKSADPGDAPIVANLQKIKALYAFLSSNLQNLQAFRVEAGVQVPIYLTGSLPDGTIIGLKTISVES